jgi:uncharacterized protein YbjT (DUF2867 family)
VIVSDPDDQAKLTDAFRGSLGVYVKLQPGLIPDSHDFGRYQSKVVDALVVALAKAEVPRAVVLSGWGANDAESSNPLWALRYMEQQLGTLPALNLVFLRAGWFMENLLPLIHSILTTGHAEGPLRGDLPLPMISTADIGRAVAALLQTDIRGKTVLELQGPQDCTMEEAVRAIGQRVGRPEASYRQVTEAEAEEGLLASSFSQEMARGVVQIATDVNAQRIRMQSPRSTATATPTTLEEFLENIQL